MNIPSRHEAQQRADRIHAFQNELARLEQEGVVALGISGCAAEDAVRILKCRPDCHW